MAALGFCLRKTSNCRISLALFNRAYPNLAPSFFEANIQPVRCKGTQRFRAPPKAKEKEKWQPKKRLTADEIMSPKELKEFQERVPHDDVWIQKYYPLAKHSFEQAVTMHRELAMPEMQDNEDGTVYLDADLDLSTSKKTKFLGAVKGTVLLPHNFEDNVQSRVIALTKKEEDQEKATQLGAVFVGGIEVIRMIEKGEIKQDDFDHVVLNMDCLVEAALIKKTLKDRFPAKKKGNLGTDTEAMVRLFVNGRSFESTKLSDSLGKITFAFGKLNMDIEQLKANFRAIVEAISAHKPPSVGGPIFSQIRVSCPPSNEKFLVEDETVVPKDAVLKPSVTSADVSTKESAEEDEEESETKAAKAEDEEEESKAKKANKN